MGLAHGVAQLTAETILRRGVVQKRLHFNRQTVDDLFQQIITNQPFAAVQVLRQHGLIAGFGDGQQPETQAGHPALTATNQVIQGLAAQRVAVPVQHRQRLVMGQAQVVFVQLQQVPRQPQPRQMPVRALAAGDHDQQPIGQMVEEKLQAAIQHRALGQVVVIQHQQYRRARGQVQRQLIEQAIKPLFKGKGLVTLAHFQQAQGLGAELWEVVL